MCFDHRRLAIPMLLAAGPALVAGAPVSGQAVVSFQQQEAAAAAAFGRLADQVTGNAGLPLTLLQQDVRLGQLVTEDDLMQQARRVARASFFPARDGTAFEMVAPAEGELTDAQIDEMAGLLVEHGLVGVGHRLADLVWRLPDGRTAGTLGTVDSEGTPRFEPVLYYTGIASEQSSVQRGSWIATWYRQIRNGLGMTCVDVQWEVTLESNGALISDPAPHVNVLLQQSNCPFWEQRTTSGELGWCRPGSAGAFPNCQIQTGQSGEECLDWVVATYVVTGFSEIEAEAGVKGEFRGVETDVNVKFKAARFGSEATHGSKGRLCAVSGGR